MSELLKSYDNAAGRTCEVRYDTAHYPRPFWVDARAAMKLCATYRTQQEAEHAAAHFMATGDLPKPETAQKPREGVDASPGTVSTHVAPETHTGDVKFRVLSRNPKITRHPDGSVDYEFDVEEA